MTNHPQLKALIEEINNRKKIQNFNYGDGHKATLSVSNEVISVTTDSPKLAKALGLMIEQVLGGNARVVVKNKGIDKKHK
jgi:hypothetical protein